MKKLLIFLLLWAAPALADPPNQIRESVGVCDYAHTANCIKPNSDGSITANTGAPAAASYTDKSGAITLGGTAQTLSAINTSRKRIIIENPCTATSQGIATAENLFINFTTAATTAGGNSFELVACGSFDSGSGPVSTELISVIAATTNHKWIAKEQ